VNAGKSQQIFHKRLIGSGAARQSAAAGTESGRTDSEIFHGFVQISKFLVAARERDAEITA
jgi:hypothetical protein